MGKKQTKHFVPDKDGMGMGVPTCNCFGYGRFARKSLPALPEEVAKTRRGVTCKNCQRTKIFRKVN